MADYTADSASYADVQAKITEAGPGAHKVLVPTGTATWSTAFNLFPGMTLEGAGVDTIITCTVVSDVGTVRLFNGSVLKDFRMIGGASPCMGISTGSQGWRISGITYTSTNPGGSYFLNISTAGATYGLIDNCDITGPSGTSELIYTKGPSDAWDNAATYGTDQAVYVEDCIFRGQGYVSDFNSNAKGVVRFCTIGGGIKVDLHGVASNGNPARSGRHMEVYENDWPFVGPATYQAVEHRGGGLLAFNNRNSGAGSTGGIRLHEYALNAGQWTNFPTNQTLNDYPIRDQIGRGRYTTPGVWETAESEPSYLWGNRRGSALWAATFTATADANRNTNSATYAPGATQITFSGTIKIGVGTSFRIPGFGTRYVVTVGRNAGSSGPVTFTPPLVDGFTGPVSIAIGALQNYKYQQGSESASFTSQQVIAADRDFFQEVVSFNGTSGVGIGTRAQMDAITPTLPGVGFWVTDEGSWNTLITPNTSGRLYTWTGAAWEFKYEPFTYPHPLRGALAAPTIAVQPVSNTVEEGQNVAFLISASGNPSPTFQWRKGGVAISGKTSTSLSFVNAQLTDAGTYDCVVNNSQGSVTSDSVTLTVNPLEVADPPVITVQPTSVTTFETEDATFSITATGDNAPSYQWYKNAVLISGATNDTLFLSQVTEADEATYYCVVSNAGGSVTSNTVSLTVDPIPPPQPSGLGNPTQRSPLLGVLGIGVL